LTPSKFGVLGHITPECRLFLNFFPKSAFQPRFASHGQILRKSAVAKLPKSHLVLLTKKNPASGTLLSPPILLPLNRSRPKFHERCRLLIFACVPTLVWIGCGLPDLFRKESKKVKTIILYCRLGSIFCASARSLCHDRIKSKQVNIKRYSFHRRVGL